MPRKTKKQKILATQRRELSVSYSYTPDFTPSKNTTVKAQTIDSTDLDFVKKDLVKIALLSTIAICAQVVLWYLLEKGLVKLF